MKKKEILTVVDLFCGAGGFSEGFKQMGFKIIYGVDNWYPARDTFRRNFTGAKVPEAPDSVDILEIDIDDIPSSDVIIGGPPCTFFSSSNKGGNGDIEEGMKLVNKFLEIVDEKEPEYWIMENVPRLRKSLLRAIDEDVLHIPGGLDDIPEIHKITASNHGVPQKRSRLFSGKYPSINGYELKEEKRKGMHDALKDFPHPLKIKEDEEIRDPLYEDIVLDASYLTDHQYNTYMSRYEKADVHKKKVRHGCYGKMDLVDMSFHDPEKQNKPSRTVMASVIRASREAMVIEDRRIKHDDMPTGYRTPTVRECATLQSFPITYQFFAPSVSQRYRLVGNAVPPILARRFAKAILEDRGLPIPDPPHVKEEVSDFPKKLHVDSIFRKDHVYPTNKTFKDFIGKKSNSSRKGCRIDIANDQEKVPHPIYVNHGQKIFHLVSWKCKLYTGYAKNFKGEKNIDLQKALTLLDNCDEEFDDAAKGMLEDMICKEIKNIPDSSTYQMFWAARLKGIFDDEPYWLRMKLNDIIDEHFSKEDDKYGNILENTGKIKLRDEIEMSWRDAGKIILGCLASEIMNRSDVWILENWELWISRYKYKDWPKIDRPDDHIEKPWLEKIENIL